MRERKTVSSACVIICASMITNFIKKITDEIIIPYSKGTFHNIDIYEYIGLSINIFVVTFILFLFIDYFE